MRLGEIFLICPEGEAEIRVWVQPPPSNSFGGVRLTRAAIYILSDSYSLKVVSEAELARIPYSQCNLLVSVLFSIIPF